VERAARIGDGWMGAGTPDHFGEMAAKLDAAWDKAGRSGKPRKAALGYFSLGPQAKENARGYGRAYYAWLGREIEEVLTSLVATSEDMVQGYLKSFAEAGCDELLLLPCSTGVEQVDLLASAAGLG
jgi:alkanesulfonate monooxygenase SsuD/methylene tetrahydromethanopterin reductase-like flavin-dependent oxidoreductase (luciferase family)